MVAAVRAEGGLCFVLAIDLRTGSWTSNPAQQYNHKANMGNAWQSKLNSLIRRSPLAEVWLKRGLLQVDSDPC